MKARRREGNGGQRAGQAVPDRRVRRARTGTTPSSRPSIAAVTGRFVPERGARVAAGRERRRGGARATWSRTVRSPPAGAPVLDSRALSSNAGKLGLGSSAAVAAAGVGRDAGSVRLRHRVHAGRSRSGSRTEPIALPRAGSARARTLPRRSTAASSATRAATPTSTCSRSTCPRGIEVIVFSTGTPSSTVDRLRALEAHVRQQIAPHDSGVMPRSARSRRTS